MKFNGSNWSDFLVPISSLVLLLYKRFASYVLRGAQFNLAEGRQKICIVFSDEAVSFLKYIFQLIKHIFMQVTPLWQAKITPMLKKKNLSKN